MSFNRLQNFTKILCKIFISPYFQIILGVFLVTASELCLRKGAVLLDAEGWWYHLFVVSDKGFLWIWTGIATYILSFFSWIYVLRSIPLAKAYNLMNLVHVMVPLSCWLILKEAISGQRIAGILLILVGVGFIAKPYSKIEEKI